MRIMGHPILEDLKNRTKVHIIVDGKKIEAFEGEPIAAAMFAEGLRTSRTTPRHGEPRGVYCIE